MYAHDRAEDVECPDCSRVLFRGETPQRKLAMAIQREQEKQSREAGRIIYANGDVKQREENRLVWGKDNKGT